jgi:pimeloyl-ACP methyl ester carboxylesterase
VASEQYFDSDGVRLHYLDWGGAGRLLLCLAGLGDTAHLYRGLAPKLVDRYRVVGLTRRGHGRSDRPASGYELDTFVEDIRRFLDRLAMERSILVGHSFGGLEMPRFARRYPERVEAIVYLDALFPVLDPEPDLSGDPIWSVVPTGGPSADDLVSRDTYLSYFRRARPAWARIWCEAIEADLMDKVTTQNDGRLEYHHDDALMNRIYAETWSTRNPEYGKVRAPMLAIVPDGNFHPGVPQDAPDELRQAADQYWRHKLLPWIQQRTETFRRAAPTARVVEFDSPYHHIFLAQEDGTAEAIRDFLDSLPE